jgi:hypothetical protein
LSYPISFVVSAHYYIKNIFYLNPAENNELKPPFKPKPMKTKNFFLISFLLVLCFAIGPLAQATHLRGGEILYRTDPNQPLKVSFEVRLYLNTFSPVGQDWISLDTGSGAILYLTYDHLTDNPAASEILHTQTYVRVFRGDHIYPAPGTYRASFTGINRNDGVVNVSNAIAQSLYLYTDVMLIPAAGAKSSPHLLAAPIMRAALGQKFTHNLTGFDPDGDSLSYTFITPMSNSQDGKVAPVTGYIMPQQLHLNPVSGELVWESAGMIKGIPNEGEFALAVQIRKWSGNQLVAQVVRDFQIIVMNDLAGPAATILNPEDLPLEAGNILRVPLSSPLEVKVRAEGEAADSVRLACYSELLLPPATATFTSTREANGKTGTFSMVPTAALQRNLPYTLTFRTTYFYPNQPPIEQDLTILVYLSNKQNITGQPSAPDPYQLRVYPNPAQDYFILELPEAKETLLQLFGVDGKLVLQQTLRNVQTRIPRRQHLKSGLYLFTLTTPGAPLRSGKLVLQ